MATSEPNDICSLELSMSAEFKIALPFGLPDMKPPQINCESSTCMLGDINASLAGIFPILKIAGCALKIINVLSAIPDAITNLNPSGITDALGELTDCISLFASFSGATSIPNFCKMMRDIMDYLLFIMDCLIQALEILLRSRETELALSTSLDPALISEYQCLVDQNNSLQEVIKAKINAVDGVLALVNLISVSIGQQPVTGAGSIDLGDTVGLQDLKTLLQSLRDVFNNCAGP